jgi:hypothetical protein
VLQHVLDLDRKSFYPRHVSLQNLQTQGDVSYELRVLSATLQPKATCPTSCPRVV